MTTRKHYEKKRNRKVRKTNSSDFFFPFFCRPTFFSPALRHRALRPKRGGFSGQGLAGKTLVLERPTGGAVRDEQAKVKRRRHLTPAQSRLSPMHATGT